MGTGRIFTKALAAPSNQPTTNRSSTAFRPRHSMAQVLTQTFSTIPAALGLLLLATTAEAREVGVIDLGAPDIQGCAGLQQATGIDEWALLEYEVDASGIDLAALELEESSSWTYGAGLRECVVAGQAELPRRGQGLHTLFRYRPARSLQQATDGRHFEFRPSGDFRDSARGLDGNLAVRIEIDSTGRTLASDLLFASNLTLGALVLDHFQDSVSVVAEGAPGSKVDVVYFRFENGQVVTFSQLHYSPRN